MYTDPLGLFYGGGGGCWGGPACQLLNVDVDAGLGATVGSTTVGINTNSSGLNWGQTTQIGLGYGFEMCFNYRNPNQSIDPNQNSNMGSSGQCDADDDSYEPDYISFGSGEHEMTGSGLSLCMHALLINTISTSLLDFRPVIRVFNVFFLT